MKSSFLITLVIFLSTVQSLAQPPDTLWTRTYGGSDWDEAWSVQQTADGGYIVAGFTYSFGAGGADFYLLKTNDLGDTLWTRTYGGSDDDVAYATQQTTDGGYIIAGYTRSFGAGYRDFYLVKTNNLGDTLWTRTYGGSMDDWAFSIVQTADGGYIVSGQTFSFGAGEGDIYLIKTDEQGDTLWTRTIGGGGADEGYQVRQLSDSGYVIAGTTRSYGAGNWDFYLVRTDAEGDIIWARTYGGGAGDGGRSVEQTSDGGFIFSGWSCSFSWYYDAYLVKADVDGNTDWDRTYGVWDQDESMCVRQTIDGGFISIGGTCSYGAGDWDVYLVKTDSHGDTLWTTTYGGAEHDRGYSLDIDSNGGYIIAGATQSFGAGNWNIYLVKTGQEISPAEPLEELSPSNYTLYPNFPNPFNPVTTISYDVKHSGLVQLAIFNLLGQRVTTLTDRQHWPGSYTVSWNAANWPSGLYFCRMEAQRFAQVRKLVLLK